MRIFIVILLLIAASSSSAAMKKCQDSEGKWHYGDTAVNTCKNSKITTLTDRGFIKEEQARPSTPEEIEAEKARLAEIAAEEAAQDAAVEERLRILSIYETEADIDRQRDNQLSALKGNIAVHDAYIRGIQIRIDRNTRKLDQLKTEPAKEALRNKIELAKTRMAKSKVEREALVSEQEEIYVKFAKEKETYLKLKNQR
jgi:hypothetical protein